MTFQDNQFQGPVKTFLRDGTLMMEVMFDKGRIVDGFSYQTGKKELLDDKELERLRALKDVLFYERGKN